MRLDLYGIPCTTNFCQASVYCCGLETPERRSTMPFTLTFSVWIQIYIGLLPLCMHKLQRSHFSRPGHWIINHISTLLWGQLNNSNRCTEEVNWIEKLKEKKGSIKYFFILCIPIYLQLWQLRYIFYWISSISTGVLSTEITYPKSAAFLCYG